jgi:hypothetical protein
MKKILKIILVLILIYFVFFGISYNVKKNIKENFNENFDNSFIDLKYLSNIVKTNVKFKTIIGDNTYYLATVKSSNIVIPDGITLQPDCSENTLILIKEDEINELYKNYIEDVNMSVTMCKFGNDLLCKKSNICDTEAKHCDIFPQFYHEFLIYKQSASKIDDTIQSLVPQIPGLNISSSSTKSIYNLKGVSEPPQFDRSTGFLTKYQPINSTTSSISADLYLNNNKELGCGNINVNQSDKNIFFTEKIINEPNYKEFTTIGILTEIKNGDQILKKPLWLSVCKDGNLFPTTMFSQFNNGKKELKHYHRVCLTDDQANGSILYFTLE